MFEDGRQYEGNQPVDTESQGFVPTSEEPLNYLDDLKGRIRLRDGEQAKPDVDAYIKSLPGPGPDRRHFDYSQMLDDGMEPKIGGEGVSPFPKQYYAKGHEPFDEWVIDANTGTLQPGNPTTRVAIGAARDIAQGAFEYLLQGPSEDIMTISEGAIAGGKIAAGVGVKALMDAFSDNPDPASYDTIIDDAIADAHRLAYDPPSLPEVAGGDSSTASGIMENIARDLTILIGSAVGGNKALPASMFAVQWPKAMNWYRKTMDTVKTQVIKDRGMVVAESIYSKVGEGGNISSLLNDMGFGNALTELLDSSIEGEEDQMAWKNIAEAVLTSKTLQAFAATTKGVYRYAKAGGFGGKHGMAAQKGVVAYHGTASPHAEFSDKMKGSSTGSLSAKRAHWFVDDPDTAGGYADYAAKDAPVQRLIDESQAAERSGEWEKANKLMRDAESLEQSLIEEPAAGQNIRKVDLKGDYLVVDAGGQSWGQLDDGQLNKWLDDAKKQGKEGLQIDNFSDEAAWGQDNPRTHWAIFDAKNIEKVK